MELCHLQVSDFNATAGTIFVAPSKSGKSRHVVLTAEGRVFFQSVTAGRPAGEIIFQRDRAVRRERIGLGLSWGPSEQTRSLGAACEAAKLEFLCFHELRHSYASMLVNKGVPLAYVAAQLGHSDTRMVERHYSHLAPSALADSIRALMPTLGFVDEPKVEPLRIGG